MESQFGEMVILSIVDYKICINGHMFGVHQLRDLKEYVWSIEKEVNFIPKSDDELDLFHYILDRMQINMKGSRMRGPGEENWWDKKMPITIIFRYKSKRTNW